MKPAYVALFIAITLTAYGCSTTGGTLGGLLPAPKLLKGEINNNIYTAKDKSFSIAVPHEHDSYEYKYMQVKEQYGEGGTYISFGPAAFDQSIYRFEVGIRTPPIQDMPFKEIALKAVEGYNIQLQKGFGTIPEVLGSDQNPVNGRKTYHYTLTQEVPAEKNISNRSVILRHEVYVMDYEEAIAIVWVQIPDTTKQPAMAPRAFAESVVIP